MSIEEKLKTFEPDMKKYSLIHVLGHSPFRYLRNVAKVGEVKYGAPDTFMVGVDKALDHYNKVKGCHVARDVLVRDCLVEGAKEIIREVDKYRE